MTCEHTALIDLPDALAAAGFNVQANADWLDGQCSATSHYQWTDWYSQHASHSESPSCFMVHHTAGTVATPPATFNSKANAWVGLMRDGRLYATGGGEATIVLSSAGPCRTSSGYGWLPAFTDYLLNDLRPPWQAQGPDGDDALNRYAFNVETVHPGNGSALDDDVWRHVVGLGIALKELHGWRSERCLGHVSWTTRKIDPKWSAGLPHDGAQCIIDIQDAIREGGDMTYKGVYNVPDEPWARAVVDFGIESGIINTSDSYRDDWLRDGMTDGRFWTFMQRFWQYVSDECGC